MRSLNFIEIEIALGDADFSYTHPYINLFPKIPLESGENASALTQSCTIAEISNYPSHISLVLIDPF